jgi:Sec-independent protein translocase protein TatA
MVKSGVNSTLKRLRNHYRLIVMNEDTYEEVVKFKLSRFSVYVVFSSVFVLLTIFIVALIVFTPIKYYLPGVGYGDAKQVREFKMLKIRADSIEKQMKYNQKYIDDLQKVLQGKIPKLDTNSLELPKDDNLPD